MQTLSATSNDLGWYLELRVDEDSTWNVFCIHSGKQQTFQFGRQEQKAQHLYNALACLSGFTEEPYERN